MDTAVEYQNRLKLFGRYRHWWNPFQENLMHYAARELYEEGRKEAGLLGFEMLVEQYPQSWRAWRDFGRAYMADHKFKEARLCFEKGLEINPGHVYFQEQLIQLEADPKH